jgi:hypothetical protein
MAYSKREKSYFQNGEINWRKKEKCKPVEEAVNDQVCNMKVPKLVISLMLGLYFLMVPLV